MDGLCGGARPSTLTSYREVSDAVAVAALEALYAADAADEVADQREGNNRAMEGADDSEVTKRRFDFADLTCDDRDNEEDACPGIRAGDIEADTDICLDIEVGGHIPVPINFGTPQVPACCRCLAAWTPFLPLFLPTTS